MTTATKPVRVRYAPSPTGDFHVGGARTALFDYLFARHHGGKFILRVEDTDQKRYNPEALKQLLEGLRYLELDWDEGPEVGGDYGPYVQTERLDIYQKYCQQLIDTGHAYRCFCSPERLTAVRQERQKKKLSGGYDRYCRNINPGEAAERVAQGESHTIRLKLPLEGEITVHDAIRGKITFQNTQLEDAILMKSDGIPTYHLAVVIDDYLMKISHVFRGDEWVNSLPLHIYLYQAFGWEPPVIAHLPLILNPTGKGKMSKREGRAPDGTVLPVFVRTFQELGYLPEAMVNYLALLGWSYDDKTEMMTRSELIERFSLERVNAAPANWNYDKLNHLNGQYIRQLSAEDLTDRLLPYLAAAGVKIERDKMLRITPLIQERIETLGDTATKFKFFFVDELPDYDSSELIPKNGDVAMGLAVLQRAGQTLSVVEFTQAKLEIALRADADSLGIKAGQMFQPIRMAVCGQKAAPPLFETLEVLDRETCLKRVRQAIAKLQPPQH
ncbi:MAG: glutamate--tRNA ligase [Anaerolineae bacterium]|nr:glutamate--tRNA ligase [Anaerolineae bacterium]